MDKNIKQYEVKLKKVLNEFLKPGYNVSNDAYLEILLSHLSGKNNAVSDQKIIDLPIFLDWIDSAVTTWETTLEVPSQSVKTFTLHLCSFVSLNEIQFLKLDILNAYTRLCNVLKINKDPNPSVKLGYVKMLTSFLNHESGRKWIHKTERWKHIIEYCHQNNTVYVTKEGHHFVYGLLSKSIETDEDFCIQVFQYAIEPLSKFSLDENNSVLPELQNSLLHSNLTSTLLLLIYFLESLHDINEQIYRFKISQMFNNYNIDTQLWKILNVSTDQQFQGHVVKALVLLYFSQIEGKTIDSEEIAVEEVKDFGIKMMTLLNLLLTKNIKIFLMATHLTHVYWTRIAERIKHLDCKNSKSKFVFENQLTVLHIIPIIFSLHPTRPLYTESKDEFLEMYIDKLFKISCEQTTRLAYALRDKLLQQDNLSDVGKHAVHVIMQMRKYLHRDRAVIVFQALIYVLKNVSISLKKKMLKEDLLTENCGIMSSILYGLATLIKEFKITWRESVETLCLMSFAVDLLNSDNLSQRLVVQSLQLIQLAIENFMPPNLALLVDNMEGYCMPSLAPLLHKRLHDRHWEVRDSALEVLYTITTISECKFLAFQDLVSQFELCRLPITLAKDDSESYVRATALRCITAMIKIESCWDKCLACQELTTSMISILHDEMEGIVRKEAAILMRELYDNQKIPQSMMDAVFATMASAATLDLHWEVKVNALSFWDKVINSQLSDQGMIDGLFPSVTFSKEHKKIVSLTACEILSRLMKALTQLSNNACLGVLLTALHDDCDLAVMQTAADILTELSQILQKYNMMDENRNKYCQATNAVWDTSNIKNQSNLVKNNTVSSDKSNQIIESIVNLDDITLLSTVYKNQVRIESTHEETGEMMETDVKLQHLKSVTPDAFLSFIANKDIKALVEEKARWINHCSSDLDSILDDILRSYEHNDINEMDCY